ncbi:MAG: hydrogenase [Deltaproteobacteria bacterium]|nr:hydrogenase [Deltaproteobacteria bacterium]
MTAATALTIVLFVLAALVAFGLIALAVARRPGLSRGVGAIGALIACAVGATASVFALIDGGKDARALDGILPIGRIAVGIDPLSAFFLLAVFVVSGLAALYAFGYFAPHRAHTQNTAPTFFFFNLLIASIAGVVIARNGVIFLVLWEIMSIASYFLVVHDHERPEVRRAGFVYLVASHVGVVFLFVLFALLASPTGQFGFEAFHDAATANAGLATGAFVLALLGFGLKAGFWPGHLWLPEAHPAAPSPVSAVLSGVMIKMAFYGLFRIVTFIDKPAPAYGLALLAIGIVTGVMGIVLALGERDLKRILAYSSVENVGVIAIGFGIGLIGKSHGNETVAALGFGGALLHVVGHGLFKSVLFQAVGNLVHASGTRALDAFGGVARRMPTTAALFLVGAAAVSGLPPLAGFVSEWLIYVGALKSTVAGGAAGEPWAIAAVPALALIGGLALAVFARVFGLVFLGEPRRAFDPPLHEASRSMRLAPALAAILCVVIGVAPLAVVPLLSAPTQTLVGTSVDLSAAFGPLPSVMLIVAVLAGIALALALLRRALLRGREVRTAPTWGCAYESPSPRMQYTGTSFSAPLVESMSLFVSPTRTTNGPTGYFPTSATHHESTHDIAAERVVLPGIRAFVAGLSWIRRLQRGRLHLYVVYVFAVLVILLIWQLAALRGAA